MKRQFISKSWIGSELSIRLFRDWLGWWVLFSFGFEKWTFCEVDCGIVQFVWHRQNKTQSLCKSLTRFPETILLHLLGQKFHQYPILFQKIMNNKNWAINDLLNINLRIPSQDPISKFEFLWNLVFLFSTAPDLGIFTIFVPQPIISP